MSAFLLELPTDHPRPAVLSRGRAVGAATLSSDVLEKKEHLGQAPVAALAGFVALLWRYARQDELIVGLPLFGLKRANRQAAIEFVGDPLALRLDVSDSLTVKNLVARVSAAVESARLADGGSLSPHAAVGPPLQALFNWQAAPDWSWTNEGTGHPYELALSVTPNEDGWDCEAHYSTDLFSADTISRLLDHYGVLLAGMAEDPNRLIADLPILTAAEHRQLVVDWNRTAVEFPNDKCLHQQFEERVDLDPAAPAVICGPSQLSYGELNSRANQLAHHIRRMGVAPGVLVGILAERSIEMVVGLMAIAKAGGAYVPIDASYPRDRIAFMLEDSNVSVLLTQEHLLDRLPPHDTRIVCLDRGGDRFAQESAENVESGVTASSLIYVIYTSGSTGRPKGVMLDHRGRVSNFADFNRRFSVGPGDRLLGISSLSFDMCAYDVFGVLAAGATLVVAEREAIQHPALTGQLVVEHQITVWHSVPALLNMLVDYVAERPELHPHALRLVLLGGDWIPVALPGRLRSLVNGVRVISMGGATEVSMDSTIYEIKDVDPRWTSIPYGAPMWNQLAYVLDRRDQLVPIGVPGQLHLGGVGVAHGYHGQPGLTAEKFVPNPFVDDPNARIYRTGDLARFRPDGNLELLGRMDYQVKIRGFRIELGEIEALLRKHPAVKEAVVLAHGDRAGNRKLVGYVVPNSGHVNASADIEQDHVNQWQTVYDTAYSKPADPSDPAFNIASWDSSYTGEPIAAEQMSEWVDETVARIRAHGPSRVLEIGCGLGLLLFRLAPHAEKYWGTDISAVALDHVSRHLSSRGLQEVVTVSRRLADNFDGIGAGDFDTVILNSIVLDFPSVEYLLDVLKGAARAVEPGGVIVVGDIRSKFLAPAFYAAVELHRSQGSLTTEQLDQRIRKRSRMEEELLIDPGFFACLPQHVPDIGHVDIHLKRGSFSNELIDYRYDVTLHVGTASAPRFVGECVDWMKEKLTLDSLRRLIESQRPEQLHIRRVPNARLVADVRMAAAIDNAEGTKLVELLKRELKELREESHAIDPEEAWALCEDLGYDVNLRYTSGDEPDAFDIVLLRKSGTRPLFPCGFEPDPKAPLSSYCNDPLKGRVATKLIPTLRRHLEATLPDHMVPSHFVLLDALPLTPNGKVSRRALPEPDTDRPDLDEAFVAPRTPVESVIAGMWAEVLGLDRVGVRDDFFVLGGHSLLVTQVSSRIRDTFQLDLPLRTLFEAPTVAGLAERLEQQGRDAEVNVTEVARTLIEIGELSDDQAKALLAETSGEAAPHMESGL